MPARTDVHDAAGPAHINDLHCSEKHVSAAPCSGWWTPNQRSRLIEIVRNLADRIEEARSNVWLGEVQGLRTSLEAARFALGGRFLDHQRAPQAREAKLISLDRSGQPVNTSPNSISGAWCAAAAA